MKRKTLIIITSFIIVIIMGTITVQLFAKRSAGAYSRSGLVTLVVRIHPDYVSKLPTQPHSLYITDGNAYTKRPTDGQSAELIDRIGKGYYYVTNTTNQQDEIIINEPAEAPIGSYGDMIMSVYDCSPVMALHRDARRYGNETTGQFITEKLARRGAIPRRCADITETYKISYRSALNIERALRAAEEVK